jgi:hypothetical protein
MREKLIDVFCTVLGAEPDYRNEDAIQFVDELIANGVTIQKWIPVTERLPSRYRSVIVWTRDREMGEAQHDGKRFCWCEDDNYADVTHWMPLPEPPKGE